MLGRKKFSLLCLCCQGVYSSFLTLLQPRLNRYLRIYLLIFHIIEKLYRYCSEDSKRKDGMEYQIDLKKNAIRKIPRTFP